MSIYRRTFRSQTSDNMERWKSRGGKSQRREEKKKEDQRRERVRRQKMQVRKKVVKSRNTVFFWWFVAPEGRKVGSLKRRVWSRLGDERWKTACRCGAKHISKSKVVKTDGLSPLLGSWEWRSARRCGGTHISKSKCTIQNTPFSEHFWKLRCRKSARHCGTKRVSKSTCAKRASFRALLEVEMSNKCTPLWREAHSWVKMFENTTCSDHFEVQMWFCVAGARASAPCQKWATCEGFVAFPKTMARRGTFEQDMDRCISRGRRSARDMCIRDVRRSGRWFPEKGCILEHQIFRFAKVILRGGRSTWHRWSGKVTKRIGTRPSALHSIFHFWNKSRRIALILMLSTSKIEQVSQNCFVFDTVKFKNWGSLAE